MQLIINTQDQLVKHFITNLTLEWVLTFLWKWPFLSTQFLCSFLSGLNLRHFLTARVNFLRKIARQFLMHLDRECSFFFTLKKFENWFLMNRFLIKKCALCILWISDLSFIQHLFNVLIYMVRWTLFQVNSIYLFFK